MVVVSLRLIDDVVYRTLFLAHNRTNWSYPSLVPPLCYDLCCQTASLSGFRYLYLVLFVCCSWRTCALRVEDWAEVLGRVFVPYMCGADRPQQLLVVWLRKILSCGCVRFERGQFFYSLGKSRGDPVFYPGSLRGCELFVVTGTGFRTCRMSFIIRRGLNCGTFCIL